MTMRSKFSHVVEMWSYNFDNSTLAWFETLPNSTRKYTCDYFNNAAKARKILFELQNETKQNCQQHKQKCRKLSV